MLRSRALPYDNKSSYCSAGNYRWSSSLSIIVPAREGPLTAGGATFIRDLLQGTAGTPVLVPAPCRNEGRKNTNMEMIALLL